MGFGDWFVSALVEIVGGVVGQLGVGADDEPDPAVGLVGCADAGRGPAQGLLVLSLGIDRPSPASGASGGGHIDRAQHG